MNIMERRKPYYTISEAASFLTKKLGEPVTAADILQYGLSGQIALSVYFVTEAYGWRSVLIRKQSDEQQAENRTKFEQYKSEAKATGAPLVTQRRDDWHVSGSIDNKYLFLSNRERDELNGVWDLAMAGGELDFLRNHYMRAIGESEIEPSLDDILVCDPAAGQHYIVVHGEMPTEQARPVAHMPSDVLLVVRTDELFSFCCPIMEEKAAILEAEQAERKAPDTEPCYSPAPAWTIKPPRREQTYSPALGRALQYFYDEGHPAPPTAREVLEYWRNTKGQHLELIQVLADEANYYDSNGDAKALSLDSLRKAIARRIE